MTEGLIACPSCGAMVPSLLTLRDDQEVYVATKDPTMHVPPCTYCAIDRYAGLPQETQEHWRRMDDHIDAVEARERQERDRYTITTALWLASEKVVAPTEDLLKVLEWGKKLVLEAICTADDQNNAEFFVTAYEEWGAVIDEVLADCGRPHRNVTSGEAREQTR